MSKKFLTEDIVSTLSTSSQQEDDNNHTEQSIGHEFSSNIRIAELAIRSTAYKLPSTSTTSPTSTTIADSKVEPPDTTIKQKRRVTFNLDNIQVKTISDYDSDSFSIASISDTSSLHEDSDEEEQEERIATNSNNNCNIDTKYQERSIQEPIVSAERISKKASYDALQKRKQSRRDHQQPITKPGYWYPLASPRTSNPTRQTLTIRSLELTEKLINETIQREMLLNPSIKQQYTPPSPSPSPRSDLEEPTCSSSSSSAKRYDTILVSDTDEEEEEKPSTSEPTTTHIIPSDEDISATPILSKEEQRSDFTKSVYRQVSPISDYEPPCLTFPYEQNLVPVATNKKVLIISPPPSPQQQQFHESVNNNSNNNNDPVWVDHHTDLLINKKPSPKQERRGIFFVKVLKVESLDFPIENDHTKTFCTINYNGNTSKSSYQMLSHTMEIENEMQIQDVEANKQITITIHVEKKNTNSWYSRIRSSSSDLERYIHEKDGSICQTIFLPSRFAIDGSTDQKATLMLVNDWFQETGSNSSSLLLKRSSSFKKKKPSHVRKAVGKIYIQCLYLTVAKSCQYIPTSMNEALEALNTKRFHQTKWQSGYLLYQNENSKSPRKRFFTLTGGNLFVQLSEQEREPSYKIPLSSVKNLTWDQSSLDNLLSFQLSFENEETIYFTCQTLVELQKWIAVLELMIYKLPKLPEWITL